MCYVTLCRLEGTSTTWRAVGLCRLAYDNWCRRLGLLPPPEDVMMGNPLYIIHRRIIYVHIGVASFSCFTDCSSGGRGCNLKNVDRRMCSVGGTTGDAKVEVNLNWSEPSASVIPERKGLNTGNARCRKRVQMTRLLSCPGSGNMQEPALAFTMFWFDSKDAALSRGADRVT